MDISVLVNNVGVAGAFGPLSQIEDKVIHDVISCNMYGNVLLTREIVESFKKRYEKTGQRSCITFTSAMAAIVPIPNVGIYSASKIFTDFLAWGLQYELARYGVDVSAWRAAGVSTNILDNPEPDMMVSSAENYVSVAMSKVTSGVHAGYFPHELIHLFWTNVNDIMPQSLCVKFFRDLIAGHA